MVRVEVVSVSNDDGLIVPLIRPRDRRIVRRSIDI